MQTDPGVPIVYAGFGALMLTTCVSFLSHTQVFISSIFVVPIRCYYEYHFHYTNLLIFSSTLNEQKRFGPYKMGLP